MTDLQSIETLRSEASEGAEASTPAIACLTIACHPDAGRIGERLLLPGLLAGRTQRISRVEGRFAHPGRADGEPLADPYISRTPLEVRVVPGRPRALCIVPGKTTLHLDGQVIPPEGCCLSLSELPCGGAALRLGSRTLLWLHERRELPDHPLPELFGESDAMRALRVAVTRAARHAEPVLILGETGSGKELVARSLHAQGPRARGPFLAVNMATLSESMAGTELFGHVRGAFTGADRGHRGLFERADGGVLFMDEIGDTPASVQPMLLRVLEAGRLTPLGAERERVVDVRLIAATDQDLSGAIEDGRFRAPLFHRLSGQVLRVPPLRERRDDIGRLLVRFMRETLQEHGCPQRLAAGDGDGPVLRPQQLEALLASPCDGNVRELRNLARRMALALVDGTPMPVPAAPMGIPSAQPERATVPPSMSAPEVPAALDEDAILQALRDHDFIPERAAKQLGVASSTVHYFMRRSDRIRRATDLSDEEIRDALTQASGDLARAARALQVSRRALGMAARQRGMLV